MATHYHFPLIAFPAAPSQVVGSSTFETPNDSLWSQWRIYVDTQCTMQNPDTSPWMASAHNWPVNVCSGSLRVTLEVSLFISFY